MKSISKDARGFVEGVINHLKQSGKIRDITPKVQSLLFKMTASAKREHQARVESVISLTQTELSAVARILSRISGHEVSLSNEVNPELIGGIRITMADWVMDSSIRSELSNMAHMMNTS